METEFSLGKSSFRLANDALKFSDWIFFTNSPSLHTFSAQLNEICKAAFPVRFSNISVASNAGLCSFPHINDDVFHSLTARRVPAYTERARHTTSGRRGPLQRWWRREIMFAYLTVGH